ncbi:hypothetical protein QUF65_16165 [Lysinibacillus sphaericus]|uniref:hypothetical protein n=1 Tax=Lysinibacillus sphaericus TaxID=1421 RepID=UPI00068B73A1|nr:hypothetical protein [Lysinibacillus sphaericus]MDM5352380.1 hypothetical protein [Lysinibacillus sphaericus]PIJ96750.1 hypothetical protein CTN02_16920 [Lysinibacillus sphaericus]QIC47146.1 hypothetical protein GAG94_08470 [Lysinibacillus sphaericus]
MKKMLVATSMLSLLSLNAVSSASAEEPIDFTNSVDFTNSEDYTEYDNAPPPVNLPSITPRANDMTGYEYIHSSSSRNNQLEFQHLAKNPSSATDSVSYSVAVTQSSSANVATSATFKSMVAEVGVSTQVELGTSTTKTLSITWSIPANSNYLLRAGSSWVQASGTEKRWSAGKVISSKTVTGKWTYTSWSDKIKQ